MSLTGWFFFCLGMGGVLSTWFTIKRVVSGRVIEVPNLYGLNRTDALDQANALELNLWVGGQKIHSNVVPEDCILFQVPKPGKKIKAGRTIEITLSAGPEEQRVPDLFNQPLRFSQMLLQQIDTEIAKTSRTFSDQIPKGRVLAQNPQSGELMGLRDGVSVLLSDGTAKTWYVTPDFVGMDYPEVKRFLDRHGLRTISKFKSVEEGAGQLVMRQIPQAGYPLHIDQTITLEVNKE